MRRLGAILAALARSGARVSELLALRDGDLLCNLQRFNAELVDALSVFFTRSIVNLDPTFDVRFQELLLFGDFFRHNNDFLELGL